MASTSITFRISEESKEHCKEILEAYGMTISDYCRLCFEYMLQTGRPAVKWKIVCDDGAAPADEDIAGLEGIVRHRLSHPQPSVKVSLKDL